MNNEDLFNYIYKHRILLKELEARMSSSLMIGNELNNIKKAKKKYLTNNNAQITAKMSANQKVLPATINTSSTSSSSSSPTNQTHQQQQQHLVNITNTKTKQTSQPNLAKSNLTQALSNSNSLKSLNNEVNGSKGSLNKQSNYHPNTQQQNPSKQLSKSAIKEKSATFLTDAILSLNDASETSNKTNSKQENKKSNKKTVKSNSNKKSSSPTRHPQLLKKASNERIDSGNNKPKTNQQQQQQQSTKLKANNDVKNGEKLKPDIRARYWAYLFDNLKRAVNEIYETCENEENINESKEAILILENCTNDFRSLINRLVLMQSYENNNNKLSSLAWEVPKSLSEKFGKKNELKNANREMNKNKEAAEEMNEKTGFKDFVPYFAKNSYDEDEDINAAVDEFDDEEESEDEDRRLLKPNLNDFNEIDPMDIYNQETFSDMQSINTEDMSFNALSITPPPISSKSQMFPSSSTTEQLCDTSSSLFKQNNSLINSQSNTNSSQIQPYQQQQQQQFNTQQFPYLPNSFQNSQTQLQQPQQSTLFRSLLQDTQCQFPNVPPSSLNNSFSTHSLPNKIDKLFNFYNYSTFITNPSDFNLFNLNNNIFGHSSSNHLTNDANLNTELNNLLNSNKIINNLLLNGSSLNESFDNGSALDDSFRLSRIDEEKSGVKVSDGYEDDNENDDEDEDEEEGYGVVDEEDDDFNEEDFAFDFLKKSNETLSNNKQSKESKMKKLNDEVANFDPIDQVMLKAYEEEENLVLEIEKVQDKELLSVLAQEAKLTKQLSVEKLMHYNQYQKYKHEMNDTEDGDDTDAGNSKLLPEFDVSEAKRNRKINDVFWKKYNNKMWRYGDIEAEMDNIRTPGRALQMHEKLSSMSRKASPSERRRKHEEKQARAQEKREQFYQDRSKKLRELTKKIEEVRELKKKLLKVKLATMKAKLQRAEEKRQYLLRLKAKKAAVEEQKAHEIAFINNLVAQNRKHDILEKYEKRHEMIKHNLEEERLRKQEEQKAKEHAAELRRKELETQRMTKLKEMLEKRRLKQSKIEQTQMEKEKERIETAKAKERTREMRLAIIEAQFQANKQEVKKRILQKQEEWSKRHESNLEEIRKKAFEMSILHFSSEDNTCDAPTPVPYDKAKCCNVCNVMIKSEVQLKSHLRGIKHQQIMNERNQGKHLTKSEIEEFNLNCIVDAPNEVSEKDEQLSEERKRNMKKRLKKIKNRITNKGVEYENNKKKTYGSNENSNGNSKSKLPKLVKELEKQINTIEKSANLDRTCSEINRILQKNPNDQEAFRNCDGLNITVKLLEQLCQSQSTLPNNTHNLLLNASRNNTESCCDLMLTNKMLTLLELLNIHSGALMLDELNSSRTKQSSDLNICSNLLQLIGSVFNTVNNENDETLSGRVFDFISLMSCFGLMDAFSVYFSNIRGPLDDDTLNNEILHNSLNFLIAVTKFLSRKKSNEIFSEKKVDDCTQLIGTFKATNLVNIVSMLYGMLHKDASTPVKYDTNAPSAANAKKLHATTLDLTTLSVKLLNRMILLDINMVQNLLGEESLSLQLRHIASYLIWYLNSNRNEELLHEMILLIGYFTVLNNDNQIKMELGTPPTILQQLCNLPFNYFSDKKLIAILYPTLICFCYGNEKNKCVLTSEMSSDTLASFIQEQIDDAGKAGDKAAKARSASIDKFELRRRFPEKLWNQAFHYFSQKTK